MNESHGYVILVEFSSLLAAQTRNSEFDQNNQHETMWRQFWMKIVRIWDRIYTSFVHRILKKKGTIS